MLVGCLRPLAWLFQRVRLLRYRRVAVLPAGDWVGGRTTGLREGGSRLCHRSLRIAWLGSAMIGVARIWATTLSAKEPEERPRRSKGVSGSEVQFAITNRERRAWSSDSSFVLAVVTDALTMNPRLRTFRGLRGQSRFEFIEVGFVARLVKKTNLQ